MDNTLRHIQNLIKAALIEAAEQRPDLFAVKIVQQNTPDSDILLNSEEAARFLKISRKKLYQLYHSGIIPGRRIGKRKILFSRKDLLSVT